MPGLLMNALTPPLPTLLLSCAVALAETAAPNFDQVVDKVVCHSKSLTVCQDDYCFVSFDGSDETMTMSLDFKHATYVLPSVSPEQKTMTMEGQKNAPGSYSRRFGIELAHDRSANVEFIANQKNDGSYAMSAPTRHAYAAYAGRSQIVTITASECEKAEK